MKTNNQKRFEAYVRAFWLQGSDIGLKMEQSLREDVGETEMENLSTWYDAAREAQIETVEAEMYP